MSEPAPPRWQSLLADLKRRQVFRVAALYGAAAFVVLQAADLLLPRLGLPDWTVTFVVALAILGLPLALALAWSLETTPEGVRRTAPPRPGELEAIVAQPRSRRWPAGLAALAGMLLLAAGAAWTLGLTATGRAARYDSIAVLPFTNLSGDRENEYFGDGLAEELLNALAGVEGLKVAARTSAFAFKGSRVDVRTIGDTLGVATVLEGSVRRSADRIRITAQLIDARSGYHLWSETYDRPLTDLFAVQDELAAEIVQALRVRLAGAEAGERLHRGGTADAAAYDLYLQGRQKWATRDMALLREALGHFQEAIARDSAFALAWSGMADALDALAWRRDTVAMRRIPDAKYAAQRAILLDPQLAEGWASLGVLALEFDRDWRVAELALRRAVELRPSYATARHWLADALLYAGKPEESIAARRRAREIDPVSAVGMSNYIWALGMTGRWEEAREVYLGQPELGRLNTATLLGGATNARRLGFTEEQAARYARHWAVRIGFSAPGEVEVLGRAMFHPRLRPRALETLRRMEAEGTPARELAGAMVALGEHEQAIRLLRRAWEKDEPQLILTLVEPVFEPLHGDPRFREMTGSLGQRRP